MVFVSDGDFSELREPSEATFDFPTAFVAAQCSSILRLDDPVGFVRRDHLDAVVV